MERLTEEKQLGPWASLKDHAEAIPGAFANYDCLMAHMTAVTRLKAYEDTGLTPSEVDMDHEAAEELRRLCRDYDLGRLEALAEADKDGRIVVLPCKVGDTVWVIDKGDYKHNNQPFVREKAVYEITCKQNKYGRCLDWGVCLGPGDCGTIARYRLEKIGKSWFVTCAEAEKALEAMKDA